MFRKTIFLGLFCFVLAIAACRNSQETGKIKIAVIPKATSGAFWQTVHAGAKKGAEESGVDMVWIGTEREDQRTQQINIVDSQVVNQVNGIVLAPLDREALVKPVQEAVRAQVPVVIIDSNLAGSEQLSTSFVATDNRSGGKLAGKELGRVLNGRGAVVLLRHQEGSASTASREAGFLEALKEFPQIKVLSSEQYGGRDPQKAAENLLLRFSKNGKLNIDGIFCPNLTTTYGMMQALRRGRYQGQVKLIGFDSDESLVEGLKKGEIEGLVIQDPFKIGYLGVKTLVQHIKGRGVPKRTDTGVVFVTKANLNNPIIQNLLFPPLDQWLKH